MKKILQALFMSFCWWILRFRYKFIVKGLDEIAPEKRPHTGGILFLPNHSSVFIDPAAVAIPIWKQYPIRPLVTDYVYYTPFINYFMRYFNVLPVPDNESGANSQKKRRSEEAIQEVVRGLNKGDNFLIYPAGRCKISAKEALGGASGVHSILRESDNCNVVLVRTKGLWGSLFSKAYTLETPHALPTLRKGFWILLKNLLFFTPRREIVVEYQLAPKDFPRKGSRLEMNRWLEDYYNRPDGLSEQQGKYPGESLVRVPYSFWNKKDILEPMMKDERLTVSVAEVPKEIQEAVKIKIGELSERSPSQIRSQDLLAYDLALDSLDIGDLAIWLETQYDIEGVPVKELDSVGKVMILAAGLAEVKKSSEKEKKIKGWNIPRSHESAKIADGETIPEVFLNKSKQLNRDVACGDDKIGVLTYRAMRMRVVLLAEYIRHLPGEAIGIMLPSSVAATLLILAVQLAGKVPVMVNWTVGPRHLQSIKEVAQIQKVLTAWSFIDRLSNVDTTPIDGMLVFMEELVAEIGIVDKLRAAWRSMLSTKKILKIFGADRLTAEDRGVILLTSGTESQPKGVPLSYRNLLTNQRATIKALDLFLDDILVAILPPFHSFGFTVTSLTGLLAGLRTAYIADPTDGGLIARGVKKWGATLIAAAPTFLKNILYAGTYEQLKTLRYIASGAEKTPLKLFEMVDEMRLNARVYEGYGITECSPVITANRIGTENIGVGQPIENVELKVVHLETLQPLAANENGLILVRGPNVFSGYLNKGLISPFVEVEGKSWYNTGDLGYLTKENFLVISGRQKRFIKVGGEMISLASIENALLEMAHKKGWLIDQEGASLAICTKEIEQGKPLISLYVKFSTTLDEVNNALRESGFSNLVRVNNVVRLAEIPLMGTGKINYRGIEEMNA